MATSENRIVKNQKNHRHNPHQGGITAMCNNTFGNLDKCISQFGQICCQIFTNTRIIVTIFIMEVSIIGIPAMCKNTFANIDKYRQI